MNIVEALDAPALFGGMFDAPSWDRWTTFLRVLQGLPLSDAELVTFRHHTGRQHPPSVPARYAQLVVGRRGGKSRILALIATYLACILDHRPFIVPGENPIVAVIAKDRQQAGVIKSYISGFLREIPAFAAMIVDDLAETIRLSNNVVVEVHTASIAAPRGRTFLCVLADETAFWPTGDSTNPDTEVINAVRPGLSTIPYSLLLVASSPYAKRGVLYTNFAKYFGRDAAPVLVWQGTTEEMNSNLVGDELIREMYAEDSERASAEFGAQFRSDIVAFITREAVEAVVATGMRELPPGGEIQYQAFVDPSGGSADSMTIAVAHMEANGIAVLDAVREVRPPFSPDAVAQEFAALLKSYGISRVVGDAYGGEWPRERFAAYGIAYELSKKFKSVIYGEFLPALNGQRVRLLDLPRLIGQLCTLERRTARGGRDSIDHQPGAHDDVANAACGVLVQVIEDRRPSLIPAASLLASDGDLPFERQHVEVLSAVFWVGIDGVAAVAFLATNDRAPVSLVVLDYETGPLGPATMSHVVARLDQLAEGVRERSAGKEGVPTLLWVSREFEVTARKEMCRVFGPRLDRQCDMWRRIAVDVFPEELLLGPESLAYQAAAHASSGRMKLGARAVERNSRSPLLGTLAIRAGERVDADALRMALLLGAALGIDAGS